MSNQPGPAIVFGGPGKKSEKSDYRSPVRRVDHLPAVLAKPGMVVPNQDLVLPIGSHMVTQVKPAGDGIHQLIWTTQSIDGQPFVFRNLEPLGFPRRPTGANLDHQLPCPPPEQLALGDTLPITDVNAFAGARWLVRRITPVHLSRSGEVDITVFHQAYGASARRWRIGLPVELPISGGLPPAEPRRPSAEPVHLPYSGPYLAPGPSDPPVPFLDVTPTSPVPTTLYHLVMMAEKRGPGRWPAVLARYNDEWSPEPGLVYRRPPQFWTIHSPILFAGEGEYSRHSHDPLWGLTSKPRRLYLSADDMARADKFSALFADFTERKAVQ